MRNKLDLIWFDLIFFHQVANTDCSAPSGKQHEPLTGVWGIGVSRSSVERGAKPLPETMVTENTDTEYV